MLPFPLAALPAPDSAQAIGWLALAVFSVIGGVNQILKLLDRFKEKPPPNQTYATKVEHGELKMQVDGIEVKLEENYRDLDKKRSVSVGNLHSALDAQTQKLNDRIDAVPARVIALLNETKQLHALR